MAVIVNGSYAQSGTGDTSGRGVSSEDCAMRPGDGPIDNKCGEFPRTLQDEVAPGLTTPTTIPNYSLYRFLIQLGTEGIEVNIIGVILAQA